MGIISDAVVAMIETKQAMADAGAAEAEIDTAIEGVSKSSAELFDFPIQDTLFGPFKLDVDLPKMERFMEGVGRAVAPVIPDGSSV